MAGKIISLPDGSRMIVSEEVDEKIFFHEQDESSINPKKDKPEDGPIPGETLGRIAYRSDDRGSDHLATYKCSKFLNSNGSWLVTFDTTGTDTFSVIEHMRYASSRDQRICISLYRDTSPENTYNIYGILGPFNIEERSLTICVVRMNAV